MSNESSIKTHGTADNKEEQPINRRTFDYIWEDSLIVVLRDLQWRKDPGLKTQPPLFKLDGDAENALGDMVFGADDRYFMLELKSGSSRMGDEGSKPMANLLGGLESLASNGALNEWTAEDSASYFALTKLSRDGHFSLMPWTRSRKQIEDGDVSGFAVSLGLYPYLEVAAALIKPASYIPDEPQIAFEDCLYGELKIGLESHQMIAYIDFLMQAHQSFGGAATEHPLKCVIWGTNGLFWPCIDLSNLESLPKVFNQSLLHKNAALANEHKQKTDELRETLSVVREKATSMMSEAGKKIRAEKQRKILYAAIKAFIADTKQKNTHIGFKNIVLNMASKILTKDDKKTNDSPKPSPYKTKW